MKKIIGLICTLLIYTSSFAQALEGKASWYGGRFHGRKTASGEIFNKNALTCAHKTFKFGTLIKVTNKKNGQTVIVKVNDRGPFVKGRIIDLSEAAAKEIGIQGVANVKIEIVKNTGSNSVGVYRHKKDTTQNEYEFITHKSDTLTENKYKIEQLEK